MNILRRLPGRRLNRGIGLVFLIIFLACHTGAGQPIPQDRITDWQQPGSSEAWTWSQSLSITDLGADPEGVLPCDQALLAALDSLKGPGRILFPAGIYLFQKTLALPDSILLEGEVDPVSGKALALLLLAPGENRDGILIKGTEAPIPASLAEAPRQGDRFIRVNEPELFFPGDVLRLFPYDDSLLVNNTWALHSTGQIIEVTALSGDTLFCDRPIRRDHGTSPLPTLRRVKPRQQVHIRCLRIERMDQTQNQTANIAFEHARHCSVVGIGSRNCNFAHVDVRFGSRITLSLNHFDDAFNHGGGGKAYGVMLQSGSSDCLVQANNFEALRHSMILQSGANGNVFAYNHSKEPFWTGTFLPSNSAGDLVLHGNYPYMNLFEGNVVQNIVIDNSHGINGPRNTFFRNRAELFGLFMNNAPPSHGQNFIGNQVTNTKAPYGLWVLAGTDHFNWGNQVKGTITPAGTSEPDSVSLFGHAFGSFYLTLAQIPPLRTDNWQETAPLIEAAFRHEHPDHPDSACEEPEYATSSVEITPQATAIHAFPNPFRQGLTIVRPELGAGDHAVGFRLIHATGCVVFQGTLTGSTTQLELPDLAPGLYFLQVDGQLYPTLRLLKL